MYAHVVDLLVRLPMARGSLNAAGLACSCVVSCGSWFQASDQLVVELLVAPL